MFVTVVGRPAVKTVTIAGGASLSAAVDLGDRRIMGIVMPASWTAAGITFQVSTDGSSYSNLYDGSGVEVSLSVDANRAVALGADTWTLLAPWRYIKLRSGTATTPVSQAADRTITLVLDY